MLACSQGRVRRLFVVLGAALALALVAPGAASAVQIGSTFEGNVNCDENVAHGQYSTDAQAPSYRVPAGGSVITSWSYFATGPGALKLKVFREVAQETRGGPEFVVVGESAVEELDQPGENTFATNIPVQAGDFIGFTPSGGFQPNRGLEEEEELAGCAGFTDSADDVVLFGADDQPGGPWTVFDGRDELILNIAANVEQGTGTRACEQTQEGCREPPAAGCNPGWSYVQRPGDPHDKNGDGFVCQRERQNGGVDTTDNYVQGGTTSCDDPDLCEPDRCRGIQCREASAPQRAAPQRSTSTPRSRRAARRAKARKIRAARRAMRSWRASQRARARARR